jgi:hypothetical protein
MLSPASLTVRSRSRIIHRSLRRLTFSSSIDGKKDSIYLHIGPSGDFWTGSAIFAAKHLQPGYVKSILLPEGAPPLDEINQMLDDNPELGREMYDSLDIALLLDRIKKPPVER